jgi:hypothetical protein
MENQTSTENEEIFLQQYLNTLDEKEILAYNIAKEHLGMSFQLEKSIGYLDWKTQNNIHSNG